MFSDGEDALTLNLRRKTVVSVAWSGAQKFGAQGLSLLIFLILSRILQPEDFGLVAMANLFVVFAQMFMDQGFSQAIVQRKDLEKGHLDAAFWSTVVLGILFCAIGIAGAEVVAAFFRHQDLVPILRWTAISLAILGFSKTQEAILQRTLAFRNLALRTLVAEGAGGIVGVALAISGMGVWSLVAQSLARSLAGLIVLWRSSAWRPSFSFSTSHFRDLAGFGASVVGYRFTSYFRQRLPEILIGYFLGASALGYYSVGYRILRILVRMMVETVSSVTFSAFARIQGDTERVVRGYLDVLQLSSLVAFPVFVGIILVAPDLVALTLGEKWGPSVPIIQALSMLGLLQAVSYYNGAVLLAYGKPAWLLVANLWVVTAMLLLMSLALQWGVFAVVVAFVAGSYLGFPVSLGMVRRLLRLEMKSLFVKLLPAIAGSFGIIIAVAAAGQMMRGGFVAPVISLGANVLVGSLVYFLVLRLGFPRQFRFVVESARLVMPMRPSNESRG